MDAFALPEGDKLAIYVGSFHDPEKAFRYAQQLAERKIAVTPVAVEVKMNGSMLVVQFVDEQTVARISEQMAEFGLTTKSGTLSDQLIK